MSRQPATLQLKQQLTRVSGSARLDGKDVPLEEVKLRGDRLERVIIGVGTSLHGAAGVEEIVVHDWASNSLARWRMALSWGSCLMRLGMMDMRRRVSIPTAMGSGWGGGAGSA